MKMIAKICCIFIYICIGQSICCSQSYMNIGGYKIYKMKSAPDFVDSSPINMSALATKDTIKYGHPIEIKAW